jgi:hypothetical protein
LLLTGPSRESNTRLMQNVGADADEDAEEADVVFAGQGNGLAAVVSTFASLHVVGVDGITMPTASVLDTTYLTGAFANKAYTVRQDGAIRHMRICGMSHALNGSAQQNESSTKMMQRRKQYGRGGAHSLKSMIHSGASQVRCAAPWPYTHACAHTRACAHTPVHSFLTLGCACTRPHTPRRAKTSASASSATATAAATASRSVRRLGSSRRLRPRLERSR